LAQQRWRHHMESYRWCCFSGAEYSGMAVRLASAKQQYTFCRHQPRTIPKRRCRSFVDANLFGRVHVGLLQAQRCANHVCLALQCEHTHCRFLQVGRWRDNFFCSSWWLVRSACSRCRFNWKSWRTHCYYWSKSWTRICFTRWFESGFCCIATGRNDWCLQLFEFGRILWISAPTDGDAL